MKTLVFFFGLIVCTNLLAQSKEVLDRDVVELENFRKDLSEYELNDKSRKVYLITAMEREANSSKHRLTEMRINLGTARVELNNSMQKMKAERDRNLRTHYKKEIKGEVKRIKVAQKDVDSMEKRYANQNALFNKAKSDDAEFVAISQQFILTMEDYISHSRKLLNQNP